MQLMINLRMQEARFVKVYRSDKLCGNNHSHKVCGNAVEKLAVPTNVAGMLTIMPYSVYSIHALFLLG